VNEDGHTALDSRGLEITHELGEAVITFEAGDGLPIDLQAFGYLADGSPLRYEQGDVHRPRW